MLEIFTFLQVNLERKTQQAVNTHAKTSNDIKSSTCLEKSWG